MKLSWVRLMLLGLLAAAVTDVYVYGLGGILQEFINVLVVQQ